MSHTRRKKNTGPNPSQNYKCLRFDSKYHNLWEVKVIYKEGNFNCSTVDTEHVDQSTHGGEKPSTICDGEGVLNRDGDPTRLMISDQLRKDRFQDKVKKKKNQGGSEKGGAEEVEGFGYKAGG